MFFKKLFGKSNVDISKLEPKTDFEMIVDGVYEIVRRSVVISGQVVSGSIKIGDKVIARDNNGQNVSLCTVSGIMLGGDSPRNFAQKGDTVAISVSGVKKSQIDSAKKLLS